MPDDEKGTGERPSQKPDAEKETKAACGCGCVPPVKSK